MKSVLAAAQEANVISRQDARIKELENTIRQLAKIPEYTQEYLDEFTKDKNADDCYSFYDSIKERGADVYMVPYRKQYNPKYKYFHPDGSIRDHENETYKVDIQKYIIRVTETRNIHITNKTKEAKMYEVTNYQPTTGNPNNKFLYSGNTQALYDEYLNFFTFDLLRIYTKKTWEFEFPPEVRLWMERYDTYREISFAYFSKLPNCRNHVTGYIYYTFVCIAINGSLCVQHCYANAHKLLLEYLINNNMPPASSA